jgi:primase-polymerase (primpol)-like protein
MAKRIELRHHGDGVKRPSAQDPGSLTRTASLDEAVSFVERASQRGSGETIKTPYYASGRVRKGLLDTSQDLSHLVTLDEAYDEYLAGGYSGIGFALANDGVGAFDVDKCLDDKGSLIKAHAGLGPGPGGKRRPAPTSKMSPSKKGLRIVGPCPNPEAYSKGGLEYWGAKRFVTLTGDVWANPGGWVALDELRASGPESAGVQDP